MYVHRLCEDVLVAVPVEFVECFQVTIILRLIYCLTLTKDHPIGLDGYAMMKESGKSF